MSIELVYLSAYEDCGSRPYRAERDYFGLFLVFHGGSFYGIYITTLVHYLCGKCLVPGHLQLNLRKQDSIYKKCSPTSNCKYSLVRPTWAPLSSECLHSVVFLSYDPAKVLTLYSLNIYSPLDLINILPGD